MRGNIPPTRVRGNELLEVLKAENAQLREENERLRRSSKMMLTGTMMALQGTGADLTVLGAEEMRIRIRSDLMVGFVDAPMARLLGIKDRRAAIGTPLAKWDCGLLGSGILSGLVEAVRSTDLPCALERTYSDLPVERMPKLKLPRGAEARTLRFTAVGNSDRVQIVVQDVTRVRWLEDTFCRYVSPEVLRRMHQTASDNFLVMERTNLTVLFADLRGFTSMCQKLEPEQVQETVNSFLTHVVAVVERFDGTIDKFVGDEAMVLFGAPVAQKDHALRALIAATHIQAAHGQWEADRARKRLPHQPLGIGIATGTVVVGNIGTPSRMDYTALGHTVNLAARLCGGAAGGEILTVPATHSAAVSQMNMWDGPIEVPHLSFDPMGTRDFKNVSGTVDVISVSAVLKA